ncbi:MAG: hypothetical protein BWZ07_02259 [Alphaproteobacteria bacterium ADurb.BinA280]|nr:MAG: hypothetical protein BWZ07_02259 [Alphaproteobacteria bacterium ADurb.BinA280]
MPELNEKKPTADEGPVQRTVRPCPFCGGTDVQVVDGSTFRWRLAQCQGCGAQAGDVRIQTAGDGTRLDWECKATRLALDEWNAWAGFGRSDMQTATHHPEVVNAGRLAVLERTAEVFVSLDRETRATVDTATAAHHLNRQPQTLRGWACAETYPPGLKPLRVMGRLAWPVAGIRAVLGVA